MMIFTILCTFKPGGQVGSTLPVFGRTDQDRNALYVTTNGGMSLPPEGGVQGGRVVLLEVG